MPIYEYKDLVTGEILEIYQRMSEAALTKCPETGHDIARMISSPRVIVDAKKPKTVGEVAHKNYDNLLKEGKIQKKKKPKNPFWRKDRDKPLNTSGWTKKEKKKLFVYWKKKMKFDSSCVTRFESKEPKVRVVYHSENGVVDSRLTDAESYAICIHPVEGKPIYRIRVDAENRPYNTKMSRSEAELNSRKAWHKNQETSRLIPVSKKIYDLYVVFLKSGSPRDLNLVRSAVG